MADVADGGRLATVTAGSAVVTGVGYGKWAAHWPVSVGAVVTYIVVLGLLASGQSTVAGLPGGALG